MIKIEAVELLSGLFFLLSLEYFDLEIEQVPHQFSPVFFSFNFQSTHFFKRKYSHLFCVKLNASCLGDK